MHTCFLHQCQTFHNKWNKHNQTLKWAYWLGSVYSNHWNTVHYHQKYINRPDKVIGCSDGDGLVQQPRLGCISRDSNARRHHRQMKVLAWPDPEILSLGDEHGPDTCNPSLIEWLNEIAPLNKVIPLGLAVQTPLKGKMIHNPSNLFWWFSWVEVIYSFFVCDPTVVIFVSCLASKIHLGSNRKMVDPFISQHWPIEVPIKPSCMHTGNRGH